MGLTAEYIVAIWKASGNRKIIAGINNNQDVIWTGYSSPIKIILEKFKKDWYFYSTPNSFWPNEWDLCKSREPDWALPGWFWDTRLWRFRKRGKLNVCTCDIIQVWNYGHSEGCPEKVK
jgi:hypothetical protein